MAYDAVLTGYLQQGVAASRPAAPNAATTTLSFYFSTDTETLSYYDHNDGAWQDIAAGTLASTTEVLTGTDTTKSVTPDALAALWEQGSDIASAGTISVGEGGYFHITGTTTITDIDFGTTKSGRVVQLVFDGALTLTHNATTLILPTGANITTAAGDTCFVVSEGGDNVRVTSYMRKDGTSLVGSSGFQDQIYPNFTTPVDGDFAWINQGGASVTVNANGGIYLLAPANAGDSLRIRKKAAPATPYTITAAFVAAIPNIATRLVGLCWRQSSDGKLISWGPAASATYAAAQFECNDWSSATAFSATNQSLDWITGAGVIWLRITDNGTNRLVYYSMDGYNYEEVFSEGRTTFMTADEVGFFVNNNTASFTASGTLLSWAQT